MSRVAHPPSVEKSTPISKFLRVRSLRVKWDVCEKIKMETHKIAGSAKIMGFEELGVSALEVETCIGQILEFDGPRLDDRDLIPVFERFLEILIEVSGSC